MTHEPIKILAIDGGGIRGIVPAIILGELERRSGQAIVDLFDLIAGSSTGGLLAMALVTPDRYRRPAYTAEELALMYAEEGQTIFSRSMWHTFQSVGSVNRPKYPAEGMDEILDKYFGDLMLSEALGNVLITSYEIQTRQPWFFRSRKARTSQMCNFKMRDVVRATTAAPTYFEQAQVFHPDADDFFALIDGGMQANNPSLVAYVEAKDKNPDVQDFIVLSLGTGDLNRPMQFEEARQWGLAGWAQHLMGIVFDGASRTVDYQMRHLLAQTEGEQKYYRMQTVLEGASDDMDDASHKNINALRAMAGRMIDTHSDMLDRLTHQLLLR